MLLLLARSRAWETLWFWFPGGTRPSRRVPEPPSVRRPGGGKRPIPVAGSVSRHSRAWRRPLALTRTRSWRQRTVTWHVLFENVIAEHFCSWCRNCKTPGPDGRPLLSARGGGWPLSP